MQNFPFLSAQLLGYVVSVPLQFLCAKFAFFLVQNFLFQCKILCANYTFCVQNLHFRSAEFSFTMQNFHFLRSEFPLSERWFLEVLIKGIHLHAFENVSLLVFFSGVNPLVPVAASEVVLGKPDRFPSYGWDNEYGHLECQWVVMATQKQE